MTQGGMSQARTVLARLVDHGVLELRGTRKGAHYVIASKYMDGAKPGMDTVHKPSKRARRKEENS